VKGLDPKAHAGQAPPLFAVAGLCVLLFSRTQQAWAYIDPGTGGAIFSWLAPILGLVGIIFLATMRYSWAFARVAVAFVWRQRRWTLPVIMLGVAAIITVTFLSRERGNDGGTRPAGNIRVTLKDTAPSKSGRREVVHIGIAMNWFEDQQAGKLRPAERFRLFDDDDYPEVVRGKYELSFASRSCFVFDADTSITTQITPQDNSRLVLDVAADFPEDGNPYDSVEFQVHAVTEEGDARRLYSCEWERLYPRNRTWTHVDVDLSDYAGKPVTLRFDVFKQNHSPRKGRGGVCLVADPKLIEPKPTSQPNVILLVIETLRRDHLSLHGYARKTSPFLQRLAEEGITFENAYSQSSWTRPSVASILTGLYPSAHRAIDAMDTLDDSFVLLPEILRECGYRNAAFCTGKVMSDPIFNYDQGFDLFVDKGKALFDELVGDTFAWIDANEHQSFFVYIHSFDPHGPYVAPGHFTEIFDRDYSGQLKDEANLRPGVLRKMKSLSSRDREYIRARYDAEILYTDVVCERLVGGLKDRGLWDNTILIITSDHGEELGEHGSWGHALGLFPEQLRVPLVVVLPGGKHAGARIEGLASGIDVMPTILAAVGLPVPGGLPGINLLDGVDRTGRTGRDHHYAESWSTRFVKEPDPVCHVVRSDFSLIGPRFQYLFTREESPPGRINERLFDLVVDPDAQDDIAASQPDVLDDCRRFIRENGLGDPLLRQAIDPTQDSPRSRPTEETLEALKDLGYL